MLIFILSPEGVALRVIAGSPQVAETLFQLGFGDSVVATTSFSDYPARARRLPTIGGFFGLSLEKVVRLEHEWAIWDSDFGVPEWDGRLHSRRARWKLHSVSDLLEQTGRWVEQVTEQEPGLLWRRARRCWTDLRQTAAPSFTYIVLVWPDPPQVYSRTTFLSDLLTLVGGRNLLEDSFHLPFPKVARDWLARQRPDRVYVGHGADASRLRKLLSTLPSAPKVVRLEDAYFGRASFTPLLHLDILSNALPASCMHLRDFQNEG